MSITIALVGNPNCGKTTLFNNLTGHSQYVGNWPGVTVEKKEGKLKGNDCVKIVDLPGIYSLSPYSSEEVVSRDFLLSETPDVIINVIDGTNLERNLYLTTQLCEMGIPVVLAVNMMDIVRKNDDKIDIQTLSEKTKCQAIEISALKSFNNLAVAEMAINVAKTKKICHDFPKYSAEIERYLSSIYKIVCGNELINKLNFRWYITKIFERDENILRSLNLNDDDISKLNKIIDDAQREFDDDSTSILINERYNYITGLVRFFYEKSTKNSNITNKIDNIVTSRFFALPIFVAVISFVYLVSITAVGKPISDWLSSTFFNDFLKSSAENFLNQIEISDWLVNLITEGIISGVGSVLSFVPQILVLFTFLSLLEDCGYMTRIAFIMDRLLHKFGFSGKSFIPFLVSSGCTVPGVMATRTIENENERMITMITSSFIPCSAKIPVIALICGAVLPEIWYIAPIIYFICILIIIISGVVLNKLQLFNNRENNFVMELPAYHLPSLKNTVIHVWENTKSFIVKAGTVIFLASILIWFFSNFGVGQNGLMMVDSQESFLAAVGRLISPFFVPLGFGNWEAAVATISGLIAKENIINTIGVASNLSEPAINISEKIAAIFPNTISALSFLAFNLFCAPCCAAIGSIYKQTRSLKWTGFAILFQTSVAYVVSLAIYQIFGVVFGYLSFGFWTLATLFIVVLIVFLIFTPNHKLEQANV